MIINMSKETVQSAIDQQVPWGNVCFTISPQAKWWALKELAKRAGVSPEDFAGWRVQFTTRETRVYVDPLSDKCITIAANSRDISSSSIAALHTNWRRWLCAPSLSINDDALLAIPYCEMRDDSERQLFTVGSCDRISCDIDLLVSILLMLSRAEEFAQVPRDVHGRFPASYSAAVRDGFLQRPIIDEIGLSFAQALRLFLPTWNPVPRAFCLKLSHDLDDLDLPFSGFPEHFELKPKSLLRLSWMGMPFSLRSRIQHVRRSNSFRDRLASLGSRTMGHRVNSRQMVRNLCYLSKEFKVDSAFYWKGSHLTPYDSGYDPSCRKIAELMREVERLGFENGIHPGYFTFHNRSELHNDTSRLRNALGQRDLGGRQHYLRWSPETWADWESEGLSYDSSLAYSEMVGFRAGTCIPYRPWLIAHNREARLLEIPLVVMDVTLMEYLQQRSMDAMTSIVDPLIARCRSVGGVFTFLAHNVSLADESFTAFYSNMLQNLASAPAFDWRQSAQERWAEDNWTVVEESTQKGVDIMRGS